nr:hypothetical protein [Tanacetum cinerariifolium]
IGIVPGREPAADATFQRQELVAGGAGGEAQKLIGHGLVPAARPDGVEPIHVQRSRLAARARRFAPRKGLPGRHRLILHGVRVRGPRVAEQLAVEGEALGGGGAVEAHAAVLIEQLAAARPEVQAEIKHRIVAIREAGGHEAVQVVGGPLEEARHRPKLVPAPRCHAAACQAATGSSPAENRRAAAARCRALASFLAKAVPQLRQGAFKGPELPDRDTKGALLKHRGGRVEGRRFRAAARHCPGPAGASPRARSATRHRGGWGSAWCGSGSRRPW